MHKFLFYNKFIKRLYMFRALCAHHQEVKLYYIACGIVTLCRWPSGAQVERGPFLSQSSLSLLSSCAPDGHLQSVTIPDAV